MFLLRLICQNKRVTNKLLLLLLLIIIRSEGKTQTAKLRYLNSVTADQIRAQIDALNKKEMKNLAEISYLERIKIYFQIYHEAYQDLTSVSREGGLD